MEVKSITIIDRINVDHWNLEWWGGGMFAKNGAGMIWGVLTTHAWPTAHLHPEGSGNDSTKSVGHEGTQPLLNFSAPSKIKNGKKPL